MLNSEIFSFYLIEYTIRKYQHYTLLSICLFLKGPVIQNSSLRKFSAASWGITDIYQN